MEKELFSTIEAAKMLGVTRIAVHHRIKSGKLKATKVGRNYVIEKRDLLEAVGEELGEEKKRQIEIVVNKAVEDYGEALKKLGEE